ncbi:MAG TPA: hypothetical protein DIC34_11670 [Treponema sp.]|nr:MAG: hypothetical protein A2001_10965 [Treponema sp. GWC1_61_84]OHE73514.1 MAG: hypothetical protein A2413_16655 [Treponema sp. RIFOXYC1_FULL_61_9]HCM27183.1 hypothetical protein [Treponema sp.]
MKIKAVRVIIVAFFCVSAAAYAEGKDAANEIDSKHQGIYYGFPAYLYRTSSASGVQLGYQLGKFHFRLDASIVADMNDGESVVFANPSIGVFYSEDWESKIRTYQGISIGVQKGIMNSFEGTSYFLNLLTGAEWFVFERKAIYLEIGTGMGMPEKDGAFEGGTVIGGGIKCFF